MKLSGVLMRAPIKGRQAVRAVGCYLIAQTSETRISCMGFYYDVWEGWAHLTEVRMARQGILSQAARRPTLSDSTDQCSNKCPRRLLPRGSRPCHVIFTDRRQLDGLCS